MPPLFFAYEVITHEKSHYVCRASLSMVPIVVNAPTNQWRVCKGGFVDTEKKGSFSTPTHQNAHVCICPSSEARRKWQYKLRIQLHTQPEIPWAAWFSIRVSLLGAIALDLVHWAGGPIGENVGVAVDGVETVGDCGP